MAQLLSPAATLAARAIIVLVPVVAIVAGTALSYGGSWSDWSTRRLQPIQQPVPFSHEHHVGGLGIDCRFSSTTIL